MMKSYMPVLESTPAMEGLTLAKKVKTMKSYMLVLESTPTLEEGRPWQESQKHEIVELVLESTLTLEGSTLAEKYRMVRMLSQTQSCL